MFNCIRAYRLIYLKALFHNLARNTDGTTENTNLTHKKANFKRHQNETIVNSYRHIIIAWFHWKTDNIYSIISSH